MRQRHAALANAAWTVGAVLFVFFALACAGSATSGRGGRGLAGELLWFAAAAVAQDAPPAETIDPFFHALDDASSSQRDAALKKLGELGPKAAPAVFRIIAMVHGDQETIVRARACETLGKIGVAKDDVLAALRNAIMAEPETVRNAAIIALGRLGPVNEGFLRGVLETGNASARENAAQALGELGPTELETVSALVNMLMNDDRLAQKKAAAALGKVKSAQTPALQGLLRFLEGDPERTDENARGASAESVGNLAAAVKELPAAVAFLPILKQAHHLLVNDPEPEVRKQADKVRLAIEIIVKPSTARFDEIVNLIAGNSYLAGALAVFGLYACFVFSFLILFVCAPASLLRINGLVGSVDGARSNSRGLSLRRLLWLRVLCSCPRVLDAWVARRLPTARRRFDESETVRQLGPRIALPIVVDGQLVEDFGPATLRPTFKSPFNYVLIHGEGGIGKTSLACQIARWAIGVEPETRLADHPMLPVLIDHEIEASDSEGSAAFVKAAGRRLQSLVDAEAPVPPDLLESLLRSRRILVIIDRFSELSAATRQMVQPANPAFPVNALVITSRLKENLGIDMTSLCPLSIARERLSQFLLDYIRSLGKAGLITDKLLEQARRSFAALVQDAPITVLLAKLYADQLVHLVEAEGGNLAALPRSIPELMLKYVNRINRSVTQDQIPNHKLHKDLKVIAWECMREGFYPSAAKIEHLENALGGEDPDRRLAYIQEKLSLAMVVDPPGDALRLRLDPLAEFLSALHMTEQNGSDAEAWFAFFDHLKGLPSDAPADEGFLQALSSVCRNFGQPRGLPEFVIGQVECHANWAFSPIRF